MSRKKYILLLITLILLGSCSTQKEVTPNDWEAQTNTVETTDSGTALQDKDTPPLPEIPSPEVIPVETQVVPANTKNEETRNESSSLPKVIKLNQTYTSPGWQDEVAFTISLEGNTITEVKSETIKAHEVSQKYQNGFAKDINSAVKGKTLEEAKEISTVAWASLTTGAFKKALKNM